MGYQRPILRLVFEDPALEGLEVRARGGSIDQLITLQALLRDSTILSADDSAVRDRLYELLAGRIVDWNLDDEDGTAVPSDLEHLREQDWLLVLAVARAWFTAVAGVSRPLEQPSPGGEPSLEESLPMEVSSPNPPS